MNMEGPIGYPPPTLVRRRPVVRRVYFAVLVAIVAAALGITVVERLGDRTIPPAPPTVAARAPASADIQPEALPDTATEPAVKVETPDAVPAGPSVDARQPNQWHYVDRLADGPGALYSRNGGPWSYALACTSATRTIEIIAVGTGDPGGFDKQMISIGKVKLMMDASYAKDGGGTMITILPAAHPFFDAFDGSGSMEVQLHADRKAIVPVGPAVIRLIRDCRGRD